MALARLAGSGISPVWIFGCVDHHNAVNRAGRQAQVTTGAPVCQDRVHAFVGTNDGINRASLDAKRAANAVFLFNDGDSKRARRPAARVDRFDRPVKKFAQLHDTVRAPRWAAVDVGLAACDGLRVGQTTIEPALGALCLGQKLVDLLNQVWRCLAHALTSNSQQPRCQGYLGAPPRIPLRPVVHAFR